MREGEKERALYKDHRVWISDLYIYIYFINIYSMNTPVVLLQTETSPRAKKKKSSKSGGAKKAIGDLLSE